MRKDLHFVLLFITEDIMEKIHQEGIIPGERGIIQKKGVFFHSPSPFARANLFYALWGDEYVCDVPYCINREYLNAFLLFRINEGSLYFEYRGRSFEAKAGDVVFLDCKIHHHYWAKRRVRFEYIHFRGNAAQAYCDMLHEKFGAHFPGKIETSFLFRYILSELALQVPNDHKLSFLLHNIISILALPENKTFSPCVVSAQQYIHNHFREPVTVADIAEFVSMSQYHFSRVFKNETLMAPHTYLVNIRLKQAKMLLLETNETIEQIALSCGFNSPSHFIRAFKKEMEVTPATFRKLFLPGGFEK